MIQRQKGSWRKVVAGIVTFSLIFLPTSYAGDATPITAAAAAPPQGPVVAPTQGPAPAAAPPAGSASVTTIDKLIAANGALSPVAPPPAITISRYQVATSPDGNKNLTITIDQDNNATVVWNSKTYTGTFNPTTKNVMINSPDGDPKTQWTFHFVAKTSSNYYLDSFESKTRTSLTQSNTTTYTFFDNGLLSRQSWTAQSGTQGTQYTGGDTSYTYTQINGNPFITSIISGSYQMLGYYHYDSKVFYSYDSSGNTLISVLISSSRTQYAVWQGSKETVAYLFAGLITDYNHGSTPFESTGLTQADVNRLLPLVNSAQDYRQIDRFVHSKRDYYYIDGTAPNPFFALDYRHDANLRYFIEYAKNSAGAFVPRLVVTEDATRHWINFIVRGQPDILSGETDDIPLLTEYYGSADREPWGAGVGDWYYSFGEAYTQGSHQYLGYGLVFQNNSGNSVLVDYPKNDTVTLDGKTYKITLDIQRFDGIGQGIKLYETYKVSLDGQTYTVTDLSGPNDSLRVRVTDGLGNSFLSNVDWSSSTTYRYALVPINGKTYIVQKAMATDQVIMSKTLQTQIDGRSYIISPLASDDVNGRYQVRDITSSYPGNASGVSAPYIVTLGNSNRQYQIQTDSKGNIFLIDLQAQQTVSSYLQNIHYYMREDWAYNIDANVSLTDPTVYNVTITLAVPRSQLPAFRQNGTIKSLSYSIQIANDGTINVLPDSIKAIFMTNAAGGTLVLSGPLLYQGLALYNNRPAALWVTHLSSITIVSSFPHKTTDQLIYFHIDTEVDGSIWLISMVNGQATLKQIHS